MPPPVAAVLCLILVLWLVCRDIKQNVGVSPAIWLPVLWILIIGSRLPSEWLYGGVYVLNNPSEYLEGSSLDRNVFLALIVAGTVVLARRSINWRNVFTNNVAITLFVILSLVSVLWSDFPFVALKRWYKVLGHIVMALIVLTDPQPTKAFSALFRRLTYILLPLSVLFFKYYRNLGVYYDPWTGEAFFAGVTTNKNALGALCLVTVPLFLSACFARPAGPSRFRSRLDLGVTIFALVMGVWLLLKAQSSAALVSTFLACAVVCTIQFRPIRIHFGVMLLTGLTVVSTLLLTTELMETLILALGEDLTLTGRTELWQDLQKIDVNPIIGTGFESFWIGDRITPLWAKYWWRPNQAHNGYLEMYLNLGVLGLLILAGMVVSGYRNSRREMLFINYQLSRGTASVFVTQAYYKLAIIGGILVFNMTDATFKAVHLLFFVFFVTALRYSRE